MPQPRLAGLADAAPPLRFPHDFARLPNNNLLVGYLRSEGPSPVQGDTTTPGNSGGVAEMTPEGRVVRWGSGADATLPAPMRPYAFAVLPTLDRFVVTSALMLEQSSADAVEVWRLSDLNWDQSFRSADGRPGLSFVRERWPHGATGEAFGHAALFRP